MSEKWLPNRRLARLLRKSCTIFNLNDSLPLRQILSNTEKIQIMSNRKRSHSYIGLMSAALTVYASHDRQMVERTLEMLNSGADSRSAVGDDATRCCRKCGGSGIDSGEKGRDDGGSENGDD